MRRHYEQRIAELEQMISRSSDVIDEHLNGQTTTLRAAAQFVERLNALKAKPDTIH